MNLNKIHAIHTEHELQALNVAKLFLSHTIFNSCLKRIMPDAPEERDGKVSINGRIITNLRFAADIDTLAEAEQELEALAESVVKTGTRCKMEVC